MKSDPHRARTLRPERQGAAPALRGAARPGFVGTAAEAARLHAPGSPLALRRRRWRDRLGATLGGSGAAHLLLLVLLSLSFAHQGGGKPEEAAPAEMMYERPGSAGMRGETAPATPPPPSTTTPSPVKPVPDLQPPTPVTPLEAPPPVPLPDLPSPDLPATRMPPRAAQNSSPLSHPMDLSFAPTSNRQQRPSRRRAGSGGPIDLALGPMVQNGQINTPYASTTSIRGVSSDYAEEISNWIRRHMYYPEDAAHRGEEGPSSVHVVLDRQGRVTAIRLVNSSGSYALDDATQGMFRNALLPPVPPDMTGKTFDVDLTIDYILIRH